MLKVLGGGVEDGECSRQREITYGVFWGRVVEGEAAGGWAQVVGVPPAKGERYQGNLVHSFESEGELWLAFLNHSGCCGCVLA